MVHINLARQPAPHHFMQMSQKTEPSHICARVNRVLPADFRRCFIERRHRLYRPVHLLFCHFSDAVCRTNQPNTQCLCQNQAVARLSGIIGVQLFRIYQSRHGQTVFHARVRDRVTARENAACFCHLLRAAL